MTYVCHIQLCIIIWQQQTTKETARRVDKGGTKIQIRKLIILLGT